jgi:hypothetical protein
MVLIIIGVILISMTKKDEDIGELYLSYNESIILSVTASEGPGLSIMFCKKLQITFSNSGIFMLWSQRTYPEIHGHQESY